MVKKMIELGSQGSKIRELYEYGKKRKEEIGEDCVFDFSIGNPSVSCPKEVTESLIALLQKVDPISLHGYSSSSGMITARKAIADYLNATYQTKESFSYIYLTAGAAAALSITLNALLNEKDEVVVIAPFFPEYKVFVENAKGILRVASADKKTFLPDFHSLKENINEKTKVVIINSPNNPTGVIYDENCIIKLTSLLKEKELEYHHPIYLLSDEPYRELIYSNLAYPFITNYYDNAIVNYSFSKSLSLPGERIGYILVGYQCKQKEEVFDAIKGAGRALGFVCASTLFQYLIPHVLSYTSDLSVYKENREILYDFLIKKGYEVIYPDGAFYLFVKALEEDANHFSEVAKQFELLLVPSDSFGVKGYVRIAYCVSKQQIIHSLDAFEKLMNYYKKG